MTLARAPGKLFLFGEYSVLAGGAAVVAATDRAVRAEALPQRKQGYRVRGARFAEPRRLPELVAEVFRESLGTSPNIDALLLDVTDLYHDGEKLGLGSSAASTVALVRALGPALEDRQVFDIAMEAHLRLQGGRGSGADIAASAFSSTLLYQLRSPSPGFVDILHPPRLEFSVTTEHALIEPDLPFPPELAIVATWTGAPARSTSFIRGVMQALSTHHSEVAHLMQTLSDCAVQGHRALQEGSARGVIDAFQAADSAMEALGSVCDLPIVTDAHRRLRELTAPDGVVVKPSGAGGGDFSLVAGTPETVEELTAYLGDVTIRVA